MLFRGFRNRNQLFTGRVANSRFHTQVEVAVLLRVRTDMVTDAGLQRGRLGVDKRLIQIFRFQHLTEFFNPPLGHEEFQPRTVAQAAETIIAEDANHPGPHLRDALDGDPRPQRLRQHRVGGQATANEAVKPRAVFRVVFPNKRHVLDLVGDILAGVTRDGSLEFPWQVVELRARQIILFDLFDRRAGINNLIGCHPSCGRTQDHARHVAAAHHRGQTNGIQPAPNFWDILDADPVQLNILPVGEVRSRPCEIPGDLTDDAQALRGGLATVETHAHHEIFILQLVVF